MGDLPVGHHCLGQNAVHVEAAAHSRKDVLQHTNTPGFLNVNKTRANYKSPILPSSPFHWCSDAEWTSHWVWEQPIVFQPAHRLVTPPTEYAHRPVCSSLPHPTGSTRLHGSHWRRARLRKTVCVHDPNWRQAIAKYLNNRLQPLWFSAMIQRFLRNWPLTLISARIWSWWSDRQRITAIDSEESAETVSL